jgi:hypothetical protein
MKSICYVSLQKCSIELYGGAIIEYAAGNIGEENKSSVLFLLTRYSKRNRFMSDNE